MRNTLLFLFVIYSSIAFGQTKNDTIKDLIAIIYQSNEAFNTNSNTYTKHLREYITNSDGTIIGQKYTNLLDNSNLNDTIIIKDAEREFPTSVKIKHRTMQLVWENKKLKNIDYKYGPSYTVQIDTVNKSGVFTEKKDNNREEKYTSLLNEDGKVIETRYYAKETYDKEPKLRGIKNYEYEGNKITVQNIVYKPTTNPSPKDIISTETSIYLIEDNNVYLGEYTSVKKGQKIEIKQRKQYDDLGVLKHQWSKNSNDNGNSLSEDFLYIDNKIYKTIAITKDSNDVQVAKTISIYFDNPVQDSSLENYDQINGEYRFDANNELIFEKADGKLRNKVNGVWEPWKYVR